MRSVPRVALLVETSLSSGQDILLGIGQYLREHGPWAVYAQPHDLSQPPPAWFRGWHGDGIIARLQNQRIVDAVAAKGVPVVDVLGVRRHPRIPLVHVDNAAIAAMAAEHLLDRGIAQFAFVGLRDEYWSMERERGFGAALSAKGHSCTVIRLTRRAYERTEWESLVGRFARWLERLPLPVGIMMCSDVQGLLLREACQAAGLTVGGNVALVGVGNDRTLCEMSSPQLSSVEANHVQVGYEAAALLDRLMGGSKPPVGPTLVQPYYVAIRESTDFLAVNDPAIAKALHFIRLHCGEPLLLDDVARAAGLSRSVLQRRFRALLNRTVLDEITDARLHRAQELLRQTDRSMDDIAEQTGFGYVQNMGRVFRKRLGQSPRHFRRRPGNEKSEARSSKSETKRVGSNRL
jgi:LacI family transcriptional regulator